MRADLSIRFCAATCLYRCFEEIGSPICAPRCRHWAPRRGGVLFRPEQFCDLWDGQFGSGRGPNPARPPRKAMEYERPALTLRELEAAAGLGLAVLLTLDHARIAGQEALGLQRRAQHRVPAAHGVRQAVAHGTRLA